MDRKKVTDLDVVMTLCIWAEKQVPFELYLTPICIGLVCASSLFTFTLYDERLISITPIEGEM